MTSSAPQAGVSLAALNKVIALLPGNAHFVFEFRVIRYRGETRVEDVSLDADSDRIVNRMLRTTRRKR